MEAYWKEKEQVLRDILQPLKDIEDRYGPSHFWPGGYRHAESHPVRQEIRELVAAGDEEKLLEALQKILDNDKLKECWAPSLADAINFYCRRQNMARAEQFVKLFKTLCSPRKLDKYKVAKYMKLLIENNRFGDALVFLEGEYPIKPNEKADIGRLIEHLMAAAKRTGDVEKISKLKALLEAKNYIQG